MGINSKARENDDSVQILGDKNMNIRAQIGAHFSYQYITDSS
jgi:predicted lipoprotein